jgi:MFS superfamily sulfate permease-like transporter
MADKGTSGSGGRIPQAARVAPGLAHLLGYRREWFRHDLVAGLSVAAVAVPIALAYAELVRFQPVVGLYASILPLIAYAVFGTSRLLIVNPDAAVCAMVAAIVAPLAAGDAEAYMSLSVALALLTGIICIAAGFLRLGFVADFLGKPVLVGFMNGMAVSIFLGQIGKVFGFPIESGGIISRLVEFLSWRDSDSITSPITKKLSRIRVWRSSALVLRSCSLTLPTSRSASWKSLPGEATFDGLSWLGAQSTSWTAPAHG